MRPATIAAYIDAAPPVAKKHLRAMYAILRKAAPKADEVIKWGTPMFEEHRILFAFAAFRTHLNLMPTPSVLKAFRKDLSRYKTGKVSIRFPYDAPLPKALIRRIAKLRVKELREKDARWM